MKIFFDTTVLVAAVVRDHPHHARARAATDEVVAGETHGVVGGHALLETYSVLTRLPVTPRIGPDAAQRIVDGNIVEHFDVVALSAREYTRLVRTLASRATAGGATYDALHLACAAKSGADRIYTFNVADFRRLAPDEETRARIAAP